MTSFFKSIIVFCIRLYQYTLSPDRGLLSPRLRGRICRHQPHCSEYCLQTVRQYPFFTGIWRSMDRISRCGPGQGGSYDPATYRVVFCSSAPIGVPFLEALWHDDRYDVVGVLTMPDMPSGRGLQMQENIIKTKAKELMHNAQGIMHNKFLRVILLHGYTSRPERDRHPWLKFLLEGMGYEVIVPPLPEPDKINIDEKVSYLLQNFIFDENTLVVGHSLGSLIAMKVIEKLDTPIGGFISVAGPFDRWLTEERRISKPEKYGPGSNYEIYHDLYGPIIRDKEKLRKNSHYYIVISDSNDPSVPPIHQEQIALLLECPLISVTPQKEHFTASEESVVFEQVVKYIESLSLIKTPHSLRLDSKKYAHEAAETYDRLQALDIDYLVVIAYGHIIPQHILDIPRIAPINIHGSLLPLYRGASPIQTALLDGQEETGITIMRMVAELDAGDVIRSYRFPLPLSWTARDVIDKMQSVGPHFLTETLDGLSHGEYDYTPQESDKATFCGKIEKEDGELSLLHENLVHIYNKYRAYYLWPKIYFRMCHTQTEEKKRVIIEDMQVDEGLYLLHSHKPLCDRHYMLNCALVSCSVKVEGKKAITRAERVATYTKNNRSML